MDGKISCGNVRLVVCIGHLERPTQSAGHTRPSSSYVLDVISGGLAAGTYLGRQLMRIKGAWIKMFPVI